MNTCRFGLITDLHYARRPTLGSREYARSLDKLHHAIRHFNNERLDWMFVLGDLIDAPDDPAAERAALTEITDALRTFNGRVRIIAGNHDLVNFTKPQFLAACGQAELPGGHGAIEYAGLRLIVLDGCFTRNDAPYGGAMMDWADSKVSDAQLPFLTRELQAAKQAAQPAVVLLHQTLTCPDERHNVANARQLLDIMAQAGNVVAAISGHYHPGGVADARGIPCLTIPATVETTTPIASAGRIVKIDPSHPNGAITLW